MTWSRVQDAAFMPLADWSLPVYYTDQSHSVTQAHQVCVCCIGVFDVNRFTFNERGLCICLLI